MSDSFSCCSLVIPRHVRGTRRDDIRPGRRITSPTITMSYVPAKAMISASMRSVCVYGSA
jgi:hypothetical protein